MSGKSQDAIEPKPIVIPKKEVLSRSIALGEQNALRRGWCEVRPSAAYNQSQLEQLEGGHSFKRLQVYLDCIFCRQSGMNTIPFLQYYEVAYYELMMNSTRWFESSLITAFVALKIHKHHVEDIMLDICPYPTDFPKTLRDLPSQAKTLLVIGWHQKHYGFIEVNIPNRYVLIKDGFMSRGTMKKWIEHVYFVLQKWKLVRSVEDIRSNSEILIGESFVRVQPTTPEGVFEVFCVGTIEQRNVTECGPIACYHAWQVIDPVTAPTAVSSFRTEVIQELLAMWKTYDNCLRVRMKICDVQDKSQIMRFHEKSQSLVELPVLHDESEKAGDEKHPKAHLKRVFGYFYFHI